MRTHARDASSNRVSPVPSQSSPLRLVASAAAACLAATLLVVTMLAPSVALAQDDHSIFWRVRFDDTVDESVREQLDAELRQVLSRAEQKHILTENALLKHLDRQPLRVPPCYEGTRECAGIPDQLLRSLDVQGVVQGRLAMAPEPDEWTLTLDFYRDYGGSAKNVIKTGPVHTIVRDAVGELFTLEAELRIVSDPPGAAAYVNGNLLGDTPLSIQISEGLHSLRLERDGYEVWREEVALTPAEQLTVEAPLEPKLTQVTVVTSAPNAEVFVDGTFLGMAGDPIDVPPGDHEVELQAPGYRPIAIDFSIDAAERRTLQLAMLREVEDPWDRRARNITRYPLYLEAGYELTGQTGSFSGLTGTPDQGSVRVSGIDGSGSGGVLYNGLHVAAGYTWDHVGVSILGVSLAFAGLEQQFQLEVEDTGAVTEAAGSSAFRTALYPLQPTARYLFGPFGIDARTGLGVGFDRFDVEISDGDLALTETLAFWNLALGGRYYWGEEYYASLAYQLEVDFSDSRDPRHALLLRVGYSLPLFVEPEAGAIEVDDELPELIDDSTDSPDAGDGDADRADDAPELDELEEEIERGLDETRSDDDDDTGGSP